MTNLTGTCQYSTMCAWCSKWDKKCDLKIGCENPMEQVKTLSLPIKNAKHIKKENNNVNTKI